ncbi:hypothetical protein [Klebsiella michiganensis]|uniref:hypothetical protein n=1 Tax=Klebsiella michiganensis TaxID=1134687 RepID=UPI00227A0931|nr:hypothetical protein [Klebsiella michiganensis]MCY3511278.1 hypothetical protein [Klebsiella michiganensis]
MKTVTDSEPHAANNDQRHPVLFFQGKKALSFEEAMKRTKEKHAEIIKRLEAN